MSAITIPNRPFSTDIITGLMLPDGIFESTLGRQRVNVHVTNAGASPAGAIEVYVESTSHPGIVVTPFAHYLYGLGGGAARVVAWEADFSAAPPGTHLISFIAKTPSSFTRIIKKIFVTRVTFDATTTTFRAETPEGTIAARFRDLVIPVDMVCCRRWQRQHRKGEDEPQGRKRTEQLMNHFGALFQRHDPDFRFCPPGYLPLSLEAVVTPNPPYPGQYGDLPFQDPWWKILLCIIAVILLIAAAIVAAEEGGSVGVTYGDGGSTGDDPTRPGACCGVTASGGSSSYVVAGLVAAAAAAATAAALSDARDPFRRGQDHTSPAGGELTLEERLALELFYPEPVALGKPFATGLKWEYSRVTTGASYSYGDTDTGTNVHVASSYEIEAPEVVYRAKREPFLIKGRFRDADGRLFTGGDLLVQCFLVGPNGEGHRLVLQDDGLLPDEEPSDGTYTARFWFPASDKDPQVGSNEGMLWAYYVIAQDVNHADPDMSPEEAAQIIGGMVITHQLVITFDEDECPFVPDGHVRVF